MLLRLCCVLLLLVVSSSFASQVKQFNQKFSKRVKTELANYNIPGAAYVIVKDGKIVALETFGHTSVAKKAKVDGETVFRLASVSKTFAATIATMLSQERRLNLNDPVTKYVPQFKLAKAGAAEKIQLKHLLSHSSGLMPNAYDNLLKENWSMEKIIGRFDKVKPICKPEQCYGYQNVAFSFLQPAIEHTQKKSYGHLLKDRIFDPLDMDNASVGIDVFRNGNNTASPHILKKRIPLKRKSRDGTPLSRYIWRQVKVQPDFYKVEPAAGVNASITDLGKWLIANMGHDPQVLSPQLIGELTTPRTKTKKDLRRRFWRKHLKDAHYGYGWRIYQFQDFPMAYHSGWVAGFCAEVGYSADLGIGFAMLINAESVGINKISSQFWSQAKTLSSAG